MRPQRLVLSRKAGFDLQGSSLALNGLPAQSVARPGKWGNPFTIAEVMAELSVDHDAAQAEAVARYGRWVAGTLESALSPGAPPDIAVIKAALAGRNLACWCKAGTPCHAELLIDLANGD
ncbi:MAG: DUF4326 domain-containing protein [Devosia sp.]